MLRAGSKEHAWMMKSLLSILPPSSVFLHSTNPSEIIFVSLVHAFLSPSLVSVRLWTLSVLSNDAVHLPKIVSGHNRLSYHIFPIVK